ncbi:MAG TPA: methionyl-tRNA formyltransferase [Patescibacteria group bacterium]|nr:methionyl-tRNA formyltransferase [Patescibacteria group bacterium]
MLPTIVFFGTHNFAAHLLRLIVEKELARVVLVITAPDQPIGRQQILQSPPVKIVAQELGLTIAQPSSLKNYSLPLTADLGLVAQYGKIIPLALINSLPLGIINVHTSLLPKYRGASPIQTALLQGEKETGITIMAIDAGLDTGPIFHQDRLAIAPTDNYLTLEAKLANLAGDSLTACLPDIITKKITAQPQTEHSATFCEPLTRDSGKIDWTKSAQDIYNQYRAFTPWPGIWTTWKEKRIKLLEIKIGREKIPAGQVLVKENSLYIGAGQDSLLVELLQLEGKKPLAAIDFMNGHPTFALARLGDK